MNDAHLHLITNHLPIITPLIGCIILIAGFVLRKELIKRTAYFLFMGSAIFTLIAFSTGENAEEVLESLHLAEEKLIKLHEETAKIFAILSYILGGLSLIGIWASWKNNKFSTLISITLVFLTVITLFFAQQTGTTGGEIRHTEIRSAGNKNTTIIQNEAKDDD
jgi:uncharacterized membrane protein